MKQYEEVKTPRPFWGWIILVVFSACLVGWGLAIYFLVQDAPRQWDFGALKDAPGESIYSTSEPVEGKNAPQQVPTLPEANPRKVVTEKP